MPNLKEAQPSVFVTTDELKKQLEDVKEKTKFEPVNAKIDPVWKAIPELNGAILDVEQTYQKALQSNGKPFPLLYKQVLPAIKLSDLPPNPIYRGNPGKKQMALMINVAWGEEFLPRMVAALKTRHVQATFFLDGSWVSKNPGIAQSLVKDGFEVGNHAYHHPDMRKLSIEKQRKEIQDTTDVIHKATGSLPTLFAPPSGDFTTDTVKIANGLNMKTILWTADTIDWQRPDPAVIIKRVLAKAGAGTLVLMHPTAPTAAALPDLIQDLTDKGYQLVTVSALLDPTRDTGPRREIGNS